MLTTEYRKASAWYVMYPLDAYAIGPLRFTEAVTADVAVEDAESCFGAKPSAVWPDGKTEEVEEYEYEIEGCDDDVE